MSDNVLDDQPLLLSVPKAAKILGIGRSTAYRLVKAGVLKVVRLGRRIWVITASLRKLLEP